MQAARPKWDARYTLGARYQRLYSMKTAHLYPFLGRDKGGIAACLPPMLTALEQEGIACQLISQRFRGDGDLTALGLENTAFEIKRAPTRDRSGLGLSPQFSSMVWRSEADVIHSHGLWMWSDRVASAAARGLGKPHVISPHGMLEPWAMANSARKKQMMWRLFQGRALHDARCLHALCEAERVSMRALGLTNAIAVVPNGVNLTEFDDLPARGEFESAFPAVKDRRVLLFMARLHPKKGLVPLLGAWQKLARQFPDWVLVIAGPDENGHRAELEAIIAAEKLEISVIFAGMLNGELKRAALVRADAFVLPSFSEGFSIAILEAMACALPVLLTPECHFPDAVECGAAIECAPQEDSLEMGLRELLEKSEAERATMGARGRDLVAQKYTWKSVAQDWKQLYQWCEGESSAPSFVEIGMPER